MKSYDLAIIGSGPGGYVAGIYASHHNLKVCVIEEELVGGTCLNRGCIPTKAMLSSASILSKIKESQAYGIDIDGYKINFPKIISKKDEIVSRLRTGIETLFRANHVDLLKGRAKLTSHDTIMINEGDTIKAKSIIVATGSKASLLPGIKFDESCILSSDGALNLKEIPKSIIVIGGGVIGCEFASLFNTLGSKVTIIELLDRLIAMQSRESSKKLEMIFKKKDIEVITSAKAESIEKGRKVKVKISNGQEKIAEKLLIAVGRTPNTNGIGLEELKIKKDKGRIIVDEYLRTEVGDIYAIGDCIGGPLLAHKASYEGILACDNILGKKRKVDYSVIPNCIYTDPEIASVGLNEDSARESNPDVKIAKFPYLASGKAFIIGKQEGFIKIIGDSKGNILGIEILGEEACDLIGEATLAKTMGINIKDMANVVHGHPTLSEIFQEAAHIFCGTGIHSI